MLIKENVFVSSNRRPNPKKDTKVYLPNKDDLCNICRASELMYYPCVRLACNHIFHAKCIREIL